MSDSVIKGTSHDAIELLQSPLKLPCGQTLPSRIVKCPMQETLAVPPLCIPPIVEFSRLYSRWARGSFGLLITGQVQVDLDHLSTPTDVAVAPGTLSDPTKMNAWTEWAAVSQLHGTPAIVQLAHPGKKGHKAYRPKGVPSQAPSAINVNVGPGRSNDLMRQMKFGDASEMSEKEIDVFVEKWIYACKVVKQAGWAGVGIHGAHGFLLSEFLSPAANQRKDKYGGSPEGRMQLMKRIVKVTRHTCPRPMIVQVKVNSADFAQGGLDEDEALGQVRWLVQCGDVDIVEISGGNGEASSAGKKMRRYYAQAAC
jgi:2,4-dienoyl-CoA reductase-like NADH-dependent reductase (Old Yellow Enzyme family)